MPNVTIISIGDELLFGTTLNTNSAFISRLFFGSNFRVVRHETVRDDIDAIVTSINRAISETDIVITTGGLGPTDDDNTVEAVCKVLGVKPTIDQESLQKIEDYFRSIRFSFNRLDPKMASIPENTQVIRNNKGLAPGFISCIEDKLIISLPGVPEESETMITESILPLLKKKYSFKDDMKLLYRMSGIRESDINTTLNELKLPDECRIGITSKYGICDLILTGFDNYLNEMAHTDIVIREKFNKFILGNNAESPEEELVYLLKEKKLTISTAESCTGGLIAKRITDIPGSSEVFKGSIIAYSNDIKIKILGISKETLQVHGAVSEKTASEMVSSVNKMFDTDISISATGIAGPSGGSVSKPVGTVCFGFLTGDAIHNVTRTFRGSRERIRIFSSLYVINYLRNYLKN